MGMLVAKHYPTALALKLADHTYVECGTGRKGWKCWGGKTGGKVLRQAPGSTARADKIAGNSEKAGIKCYLINGVCHQAANRVLLPAGITVRGARGYSVSQALYGPYGRIGRRWLPCYSPFSKYKTTTGDVAECIPKKSVKKAVAPTRKRSEADRADWQYIQKALTMYLEGEKLIKEKSFRPADARNLHLRLFLHMVDFELGPMLERKSISSMREVREKTEVSIEKAQAGYTKDKADIREYIREFDGITERFQDDMANLVSAETYEALFDLKPDERISLADPDILKREYLID